MNKLIMLILVVTAFTSVTSCRKDKFDDPNQVTEDPNLDTISIARLRAYYTSGSPITINDDVTIAGVVVANDISGNIFEEIFIDDGDRAMPVMINRSALYGDFPVGRKIYIKCKGLVLGTYGGFLQLGGYANGVSVEGIPANLITKYIVKGPTGYDLTPFIQTVTSVNDLNNNFHGRLIKLVNAEFDDASAGVPFADVNLPVPTTGERYLRLCNDISKTLTVRNSAYSKFAFKNTPKGNGAVYGIYTTFSSGFTPEKQLLLRDITDLELTEFRCDGSNPNAVTILQQNFNAVADANNAVLSLTNWNNINEVGGNKFKVAKFSSVICAKADVFSISSGNSSTQWLISPVINLNATTTETLTFTTAAGFDNGGATFKAYISTDYDGVSTSPQSFTWTELPATIATGPGSGFGSFISSGGIDLSSYSGNAYIAFKYVATSPATTFEIDDIKITGL
ncbi:MAG: choice-of-anchor J domain-containing protein [Chitinophagales bacterium]|nr:choice-of-anchor J domain-containing protein [Chitinophagales bacterium]